MAEGASFGAATGRLARRGRLETERARLALIGLALAQAMVAAALLQGWLTAAALLHLVVCATLPLLYRLEPPPGAWPGAVLRVTLAALPALGPLAALAGLCALVCGAGRGGFAQPDAALPEDPMEARLVAIAGMAGVRGAGPGGGPAAATLPSGLLLEALGDVLRWGSPAQKARALNLAAQDGLARGDALLCLALMDPDPALRARAEFARPAIARRLVDAAAPLRQAARGGDLGALRALALHLDTASHSGLLEPDLDRQCRAEAAGHWQSLSEHSPEDVDAYAALGRDLLALGDLPAARAALEAALARGVAAPGIVGWLAECLFRLRDFAALEALLTRWRPMLEVELAAGGALAPAWRFWLEAER